MIRRGRHNLSLQLTFVTSLLFLSAGSFALASSRSPIELPIVSRVTNAVLHYAAENDDRLPPDLASIEHKLPDLPERMSLDMFIFLRYDVPVSSLPPETPLVMFPFESGVFIGYLNGSTVFRSGGYSKELPSHLRIVAWRWRAAFGGALSLSLVLSVFLYHSAIRKPMPFWELLLIVAAIGIVTSLFMPL